MSKLRMLGNRVVLQPLKRVQTGAVVLAQKYMDDTSQWKVLQAGPKVDESIKPEAQVLTESVFEPEYEFSDGVVIAKDTVIKAVFYE